MTAFLHLIVPASRFRLLSRQDALREYNFNSGVARHFFCATCGVKSFYVPRSHPDGIDVNVRCLDPATIEAIDLAAFDDADRDRATAALRHLTQ